ncbi:MAG: hypothetical protein OXI08_00240 [Cyanobacteria bacterium MAG IRC4_bin_6]|nr:hypothetical protein [Cyanobacteria bacterium MAG IRC3_bin_20]MDE0646508.1 hypothetical protein [Cyanobacteria bacterium MAG IRC4_bin_6]
MVSGGENSEIQGSGQTLVVYVLPELEGESEADVTRKTVKPKSLTTIPRRVAVFDRQETWPISSDLEVQVGHWLAREFEKEVTALLKGVFGPLRRARVQNIEDYALGIHTIDAEHDDSPTTLTLETIRKARDKFGSRSNQLSTIVIHSAVIAGCQMRYSMA